ncbi:MAG: succinate dehydrogenase assembly factor 2 [Pseudomonadota bacterium]|jgi:antitoxin CptB
MEEESALEKKRKQLKFRSWHRGMREVDLILGNFADQNLHLFTEDQLLQFEAVLEVEDPVLFGWISRQSLPPEAVKSPVMQMILNFKPPV